VVDQTGVAPDDATLAARFKSGDAEAFEAIVARHRRAVYLVARRMLRSHEDADEAAQLAFIRAWKARKTFRGDSAFRTWLTRIVINVAKSIRGRATVETPLHGLEATVEDPRSSAETAVHRIQVRGRVRAAVEGLPARQREVVVLKVFSEMTYKEVAAVLGLSEVAIKAHLHQAVRNLRRRMQPAPEEEERSR
jgi:RNA polymerase sigma-70 factor (ECF subfamily)